VVLVAGLIFLPAALFSQPTSSPARSVRLSYVSGTVTVKRPGDTAAVPAQVNAAIEEGYEVATAETSQATVQLENGSTILLGPLSRVLFTSLATDAQGNKLNGVTLSEGDASFYFIPERQDSYRVNVSGVVLTPEGKSAFRITLPKGRVRMYVLSGSVSALANSRTLTVAEGKAMEFTPVAPGEKGGWYARAVRLSYVSGPVMIKSPTSPEWQNAAVNMPLQEGFELSTSGGGFAEVEFENGSTARLGESSQLLFNQLGLSDLGDKLNGMTLEQGYATFRILPEPSDTYHVKVGDAALTSTGKSEFRADVREDRYRVEVFAGSVEVTTPTLSAQLGEGKVLERQSGSTEQAFNIRKGIDKDAWDKWTEARDKQAELTAREQAYAPTGLRAGWSDLDTYGEWVQIPGRGLSWSPYAQPGWFPYSNGVWQWYPGFGWVWISSEPWGWLPYHCGRWHFDPAFGWYWMMPTMGCLFWDASLVDWYMGPGWIGWAPAQSVAVSQPTGLAAPSTKGPVHEPPPFHPRPVSPGAGPGSGNTVVAARHVNTVPLSVFQSRQMITPQIVNRTLVGPENKTQPPLSVAPGVPAPAGTAPAADSRTIANVNATTAAAAPGLAPPAELGKTFPPHHSAAPTTVLMGGDPKKEGALLSALHFRSKNEPLRARNGTTLGGRFAVRGAPGEFRGETFKAAGISGGGAARGSQGGPAPVRASGGGGPVVVSHASGGGVSHGGSGGGYSGGGAHSSGGGGYSGGGGGGSSGGSAAHSGGGGGGGASAGGGGGGGASAGGGGGHH
jgi:hypothetical protein